MVLSSCAGNSEMLSLKSHHNDLIVYENFGVCKGYGCRNYSKVGLSDGEWQQISAIFVKNPAQNSAQERVLIKKAIGLFEQFVGLKTQTDKDEAGAQLINFSPENQMDCIDEAFNSTTYLYLLRKSGLMRYHAMGKPLHRGNFIDRWPHNTATIYEIGGHKAGNGGAKEENHYVVDSWFHANGEEPEIILASLWLQGWSPKKR